MLETAATNAPAAGVTAWFTPRAEGCANGNGTAEAGRSADTDADGEFQQWAAAETVRRFTAVGQHYSIIRISTPDFYDNSVEQASISRHRRTTAAGPPEADEATSIRAGNALVSIVATDRAEPDYEAVDYDRFRHGHPLATPDGTTLAALIAGAKRMLADGGILAVHTPEQDPGDDTGVIADAHRAGLSYQQHVTIVDSRINDETVPAGPPTDSDACWSAHSQGLTTHAGARNNLLIFRKPEKENTLG